jgi:hypothetical protein
VGAAADDERHVFAAGPPGQMKWDGIPLSLMLTEGFATFQWPGRDRVHSLTAKMPADQKWHHVAVVRTPRTTDEVVDLYLDGVRVARAEPVGQTDLSSAVGLTFKNGTFIGAVDEFVVLDRALAVNDIRALAGLPATEPTGAGAAGDPSSVPGLVFHLPLDGVDGDKVLEKVSGKSVGKVLGRAEPTDGVRGKAVRFLNPSSGKPSLVMLDLDDRKDAFRFAAGAPFTIALWARPTAGTAFILGGVELELSAFPAQTSGTDQFSFGILVPKEQQVVISAPRPADGNVWSHVAVVRDKAGEVRLYVNGTAPAHRPTLRGAIVPSRYGLLWGGWPCDLDDVCVYDRALTEAEVRKLAGRR